MPSCNTCGKIGHFVKVCHSKPAQRDATPTSAGANALSLLSTIRHVAATDSAPKITMKITPLNGSTSAAVLPDSGADILTASATILGDLNEHLHNLLPTIKHCFKSSQWH